VVIKGVKVGWVPVVGLGAGRRRGRGVFGFTGVQVVPVVVDPFETLEVGHHHVVVFFVFHWCEVVNVCCWF